MTLQGNPNTAREMSGWQMHRARLYYRWLQFRRRYIPHLVWAGDEIDVIVTFKENPLRAQSIPGALQDLHRGSFFEAQKILNEVGITFDTGMGSSGRDWEWDWSLKGPISVRFKSRATRPELRT